MLELITGGWPQLLSDLKTLLETGPPFGELEPVASAAGGARIDGHEEPRALRHETARSIRMLTADEEHPRGQASPGPALV